MLRYLKATGIMLGTILFGVLFVFILSLDVWLVASVLCVFGIIFTIHLIASNL